MRKTLSRALLIVVTLVVVAIYYLPAGHVDFVENWGEGSFGATNYIRSNVVAKVDRGSPADRAGVHAGDLLVENGYLTTSSLLRAPYAGETEHFTFLRRGHAYSVTLTAVPVAQFTAWQRIAGILAYIPPTVFLIVAFLLVFLRPSIMAWSFYIFAVGYFGTSPAFDYWSHVLSPQQFLVLGFVLNRSSGRGVFCRYCRSCCAFQTATSRAGEGTSIPFVWVYLAAAFALYAFEWHVYINAIVARMGCRREFGHSAQRLRIRRPDSRQERRDGDAERPPAVGLFWRSGRSPRSSRMRSITFRACRSRSGRSSASPLSSCRCVSHMQSSACASST